MRMLGYHDPGYRSVAITFCKKIFLRLYRLAYRLGLCAGVAPAKEEKKTAAAQSKSLTSSAPTSYESRAFGRHCYS